MLFANSTMDLHRWYRNPCLRTTLKEPMTGIVREIDGHVKHLPTSQQSQALREQMARLEGRLESVEPMFKQILNQYNMLVENELRGEKK